MKKKIYVLVTDLDNTLYDWVDMWFASFNAMLEELLRISQIEENVLLAQIRKIFQEHGTSEYAFVIQELPCLNEKHPGEDLTQIYQEAIEAYRQARREKMKLYPGVLATLQLLKNQGCLLVAFTESLEFYTFTRVKKLGLDGILDFVYSPPDHDTPKMIDRHYEDDYYHFKTTIHRFTPLGERKPNKKILLDILADDGIRVPVEGTAYLGDSLMKDILMAQDAGVADVHAEYGQAQNRQAYDLLRKVSHWSDEDVEKEKEIMARRVVTASYVLKHSITEIIDLFEFLPHHKNFE